MNIEAMLLTLKDFLWILIIVGILLILLTLASEKPKKKHLYSAFKVILMSAFGIWVFPFLSTFIIGPTPGVSVEDNLDNLASKSPFYSVFSQLPMWALDLLFVLMVAILGIFLWFRYKYPHSEKEE